MLSRFSIFFSSRFTYFRELYVRQSFTFSEDEGAPIETYTAQKMKFSIKDFFSKCDQIRSFLQIWSHLLKKSLMENFIFCAAVASLQTYVHYTQ